MIFELRYFKIIPFFHFHMRMFHFPSSHFFQTRRSLDSQKAKKQKEKADCRLQRIFPQTFVLFVKETANTKTEKT